MFHRYPTYPIRLPKFPTAWYVLFKPYAYLIKGKRIGFNGFILKQVLLTGIPLNCLHCLSQRHFSKNIAKNIACANSFFFSSGSVNHIFESTSVLLIFSICILPLLSRGYWWSFYCIGHILEADMGNCSGVFH